MHLRRLDRPWPFGVESGRKRLAYHRAVAKNDTTLVWTDDGEAAHGKEEEAAE